MSRVYRVYVTIRTTGEKETDKVIEELEQYLPSLVRQELVEQWAVDADMEDEDA